MKLGLATDLGSPAHWRRLADFARAHGYPADRYQLAQRLRQWLPRLEQAAQT